MILAVRHGKPLGGEGLCYGRLDLPLAGPPAAAPVLAAAGPFERIVSSPLRRARALAEAVGAAAGLPVTLDARLAELDFGRWEGLSWDGVPRAELDAWAADPLGYRPGGADSAGAMLERLRAFRAEQGERRTLAVTHAGPVRCLLALGGTLPLAEALGATVPFGSVTPVPPRAAPGQRRR